jgi:hypothetical protein
LARNLDYAGIGNVSFEAKITALGYDGTGNHRNADTESDGTSCTAKHTDAERAGDIHGELLRG